MKYAVRSMFKSLTANLRSKTRAPKKTRSTLLRMESLEERQLLSVTNPLDDAVAAGPAPAPYMTAVAEETIAPIAFSLSTLEDAEAAPTEGEFAGKIWLQGVVGNVDVANAPVGFEIADVVVENMDDVGYIVTVDGEASDAFAVQDGALKVASPLEVGVYLDVVVTATDGTNAVSTTPFNFFVYSDADDVEIKQETVLVTGYVESSLRGEKVANAILSAEWTTANGETQSASTTTDENGFYTFRSIPAVADVALSLVSGAYDLSVATFDASAGRDIVGLNMRATPFGSVSGVLTDATGAPVAGVWVAVASGEDFYEMTKTDENGAYVVDGLRRDGEYVVSVEAAGAYLAVEPRTVSLSKNRTATVDFALATGSALTGVVRDAAGEPLAGAEVCLIYADGETLVTTTDEEGGFSWNSVETGETTLYIRAAGFAPSEQTLVLGEENTPIMVNLIMARTVSGVLYDVNGVPLTDVMIGLTGADDSFYFGITSQDGTFTIYDVLDGEYTCEVFDVNFNVVFASEIIVSGADVSNVEIVLDEAMAENALPVSEAMSAALLQNPVVDGFEKIIKSIDELKETAKTWGAELLARINKEYKRQNGYYEEITEILNTKVEAIDEYDRISDSHKTNCKNFNSQLETLREAIASINADEKPEAKTALDKLYNQASVKERKVIDLGSEVLGFLVDIGELVVERVALGPAAAGKLGIDVINTIKGIKTLINLKQGNDFILAITDVVKIIDASADWNGFKQKLDDITSSFDSFQDTLQKTLASLNSFLGRLFATNEQEEILRAAKELSEQLAKSKLEFTNVNNRLCEALASLKPAADKLEKQLEHWATIMKSSSSSQSEKYWAFARKLDVQKSEITYIKDGIEYIKLEYEERYQKWEAEFKNKITDIKSRYETTNKMLKAMPGVGLAVSAWGIWNKYTELKEEEANLKEVYQECNDTMYVYRVAVDKLGNAPECKCLPDYELVLCFDTTGSMGGTINGVKNDALRFAQSVLNDALESNENRKYNSVKISIVLYRDAGDDYVTRYILGHSSDAYRIKNAINSITVDGGGDWEEAKNTAVMRCVEILKGSDADMKQIVLATDAPGHTVDRNGQTWNNVQYWINELDIALVGSFDAYNPYPYSAAVLDDKVAATVEATPASDYAVSNSIVDDLLDEIDKARFLPTIRLPEVVNGYTYAPTVFDASASYAAEGREIVQYEWDWNNDGVYDYVSNEPIVEYAYTYAYAGSVALRVTDDQGGQRSASAYAVVVDATDAAFLYANDRGTEDLIVCAYNVDDEITITPGSTEGTVRVAINGVELAVDEFAPTGAIVVKAYDGANVVTIDGRIGRPVYVRGGNDEDALIYDDSANADATEYLLADGEICANDVAVVIFDGVESVAATTGFASDVVDVQASETTEFSVVGAPDAEGAVVLDTLNVLVDSTETGEFAFENEENTAGVWRAAEGSALQNVAFASTQTAEALEAASLAVPRLYVDNYDEGSASWTEVENALGYVLEYSVSPNFADYRTLFTTAAAYSLDMTNVFEGGFYVRAKAVGADFVDSAWSDAVFLSRPKVLNVPEWNLADYVGYDEFVLDATTDANVTATLYGKNADGELDVLKAWDFVGAEAVATIVGRTNVAESLTIAAGAATLLAEISFDGGDGRRDSLAIAGTDADDAFALGTEIVETTTPVYQNNPYEKLLQRYADMYGETSATYLRLKACYDAAYAQLQKCVVVKTATWGTVALENGAQIKFGGADDVAINAGAGNDSFDVAALNFAYTLVGGDGDDALDFSEAKGRLNVDMNATYRQYVVAGDGGTLRLVGDFESVVGTARNDVVIGDADGLTFVGNGGSDVVTLVGGENNVELEGARQSVVVRGGSAEIAIVDGDYSVVNVVGNKETRAALNATGDHISLFGGLSAVSAQIVGDFASLHCGATSQTTTAIFGDYANVVTGAGADVVSVGGDRATIKTGAGDDQVLAQGAFANVDLGAGNDVAVIEDGDAEKTGENIVYGGVGNDFIFAANASGTNRFHAGVGNDVVVGSAGNDYLYADAGNNVLMGLAGADRLFGGSGRDALIASRTANTSDLETKTRDEVIAWYAELYENWAVDEDLEATLETLGETSEADGEKDWLYRGGGKRNLIFASALDGDFENALERSPFEDESRLD